MWNLDTNVIIKRDTREREERRMLNFGTHRKEKPSMENQYQRTKSFEHNQ